MRQCIINGQVILKDKVINANVYVEDDHICEISKRLPDNEKIIDAKGRYVSPGFIESHSHGRNGSDFMYPSFEDLNTITSSFIKSGVTGILATTMTMSKEDIYTAVKNIAENKDKVSGSKILGIHLEGPFFNHKYKGAQPEEYMLAPTISNYKSLIGKFSYLIKKISLAPELENANKLIEYLVKEGVVVSLGHTDATYQQAIEGIRVGATSGTHTFNAMTPLTHRNPGVVGAIMESDEVYAELILDGIHVNYPAAKVLLKAKGIDKVMLITDSMEASGLEDGQYKIGNQAVYVKDNSARLESGTLAGSVLAMNKAVKNAHHHLGLTIYEAVRLASYNPAKNLNLIDLGELAINKKADIIMFDEDINVDFVMIDGKVLIGEGNDNIKK
ncbi:N-acetylglucosamine-6-phosphate deacetylase [Thomasclavelia cocleata]|uniref:N-acetylglucosamine-6-phosphate deacetylase n=1 Tax=Thomasclavelia cocleata TaxID=69824 RepID=A0A1I0BPZ6_9FIRM|nr:N-acetylglucosamine-6-phosphate deacetylase [Thomasclavelia cocleata]MCR1960161.1 N-acetylglucosamine-6-phosphate deacetylase [Thomasclavelia cocleata]NDO41864.1 N-acetylglucosamine-6-phosphate deacetylase [Thomasclavelia cocleata]PJN79939.1 N-acetylglucosamine-6-phosphate deacetylase [Thomasclavelia cocleata]SET08700.1 N-acetylglucosamine-6-phosphate deacetylase [Thomasclavelia cocleata]